MNLLDDHNDLFTTTNENIKKVQELSDQWNKKIQAHGYPAIVVPILWGNIGTKENDDIFALKDINEKLKVDEIRSFKRNMKCRWNMLLPKPSFPFATIRSFLIECKPSQTALKVFKETFSDVYFVTADADIISVPDDYFKDLCQAVENVGEDELVVRLGGSFCFTKEDIQRNIMKYQNEYHLINEDVEASIHLTEIIHKLDIKTRAIFHCLPIEADLPNIQSLAYFDEGNSCLSSKAFEHCKHTSQPRGKPHQKIKLTQQMRNSRLSLPDYSDSFSNSIRQERNWDAEFKDCKKIQIFLDKEASIRLSSRHDIVIVRNKKIVHVGKLKCGKEYPLDTLEGLLYTFDNVHNHQTRLSQLNMRFSNSMTAVEKVKNTFYEAVLNQKGNFPFVFSLIRPDKHPKVEDEEKFKEKYNSIHDNDDDDANNSSFLTEHEMSSIIEGMKGISVAPSYEKDDLYRLCVNLIQEMEVALEECLRGVKDVVESFR